MAEDSKIQWTHHTFNPWRGCSKVHEGCTNCYAEVNYSVKMHGVKWGPNGTRVRLADAGWKEPLKWNRKAQCTCGAAGTGENQCDFCAGGCVRPRVFCASLADVFEDWQGPVLNHNGDKLFTSGHGTYWTNGEYPGSRDATLDDLRRDLFTLIDDTPNLDWLLLTKRPENVRRMTPDYAYHACVSGDCPHWYSSECDPNTKFRENVWLGTSVSDQATADKAVPELLKCRDLAPVLFLSAEPLLGPVDLVQCCWCKDGTGFRNVLTGQISAKATFNNGQTGWVTTTALNPMPHVDWVIVGGESGPNARRCEVAWIRDIVRQCKAASVPVFVKQVGSNAWLDPGELERRRQPPNYVPLKDPKGGLMAEWPEDIRIREFPAPR